MHLMLQQQSHNAAAQLSLDLHVRQLIILQILSSTTAQNQTELAACTHFSAITVTYACPCAVLEPHITRYHRPSYAP